MIIVFYKSFPLHQKTSNTMKDLGLEQDLYIFTYIDTSTFQQPDKWDAYPNSLSPNTSVSRFPPPPTAHRHWFQDGVAIRIQLRHPGQGCRKAPKCHLERAKTRTGTETKGPLLDMRRTHMKLSWISCKKMQSRGDVSVGGWVGVQVGGLDVVPLPGAIAGCHCWG